MSLYLTRSACSMLLARRLGADVPKNDAALGSVWAELQLKRSNSSRPSSAGTSANWGKVRVTSSRLIFRQGLQFRVWDLSTLVRPSIAHLRDMTIHFEFEGESVLVQTGFLEDFCTLTRAAEHAEEDLWIVNTKLQKTA